MTKRAQALADKILKMQAAREAGRDCYQQADSLQDDIEAELRPGQIVNLGNGQEAELTDPWNNTKKVWRHTGVRRWEVEIRNRLASALASKR